MCADDMYLMKISGPLSYSQVEEYLCSYVKLWTICVLENVDK
jgi:hypothetical protein